MHRPALLFFSILTACILCSCTSRPPLRTVAEVDLKRYEGTWHEVARYPNWFQRSCEGPASAEYTAQSDGTILVVNRCTSKRSKVQEVVGKATVVPDSGNAKLRVGFGGPFKGDYWIIGLDEKNYSWAVVGHPSRLFLWLLAREKKVPPGVLAEMERIVVEQGYNPERLLRFQALKPYSPRISEDS